MKKQILLTLGIWLALSSCDDPFHQKLPEGNLENLPPETHIQFFFEPDTLLEPGDLYVINGDTIVLDDTLLLGLDTTVSRQAIHWWGDDPDGEVIGYYYQWNYMPEPAFTAVESDTFYLPLKTAFDIYTFRVWAVDNDSLRDPSAAMASFPVVNTPPTIEWKLNSLPPVQGDPDVVHKSFSHHSFFWDVYDLDGLETVTSIYYAVDDSSVWNQLPGSERSVLIKDLSPGYHRIFIKAQDIAGAQSKVISFPDSLDDEHPNGWLVQEPVGEVLIVNDYALDQVNYTTQNFYQMMLDTLIGADAYSVWEIGAGRTNVHNSVPYATEDIELNLSYFQKVFWFTLEGDNSIAQSALALTRFVADGGILFMNNGKQSVPDSTWTFTKIDTTYEIKTQGRLFVNTGFVPFWDTDELNQSLPLAVNSLIATRHYAVVPGSGAKVRYQLEDPSINNNRYKGTPPVMVEYGINDGKSYYFSLPLHKCNGNNNIDKLFMHIFELNP